MASRSGENIYDLGKLCNGYVEADVVAGASVRFFYGSFPNFMPFEAKMTRKGDICISSLLTLRYIRIEGDIGQVENLHFVSAMKPLAERGSLQSDDRFITDLARVCNHTIQCCIMPHSCGNSSIHLQPQSSRDFVSLWHGVNNDFVLFDGARRDREVWVGDLYYEVKACMFGFRDCESIRNSFDVILCKMDENGYIPGSSISALNFPDYTAWFFIVLEEYYVLSGDLEYLKKQENRLERVLKYLLDRLDGGLLSVPQGRTWAWTLDRKGFVTSSNCILYKALYSAKALFTALGRPAESVSMLEERAQLIKIRLNEQAFDTLAGAYRDAIGSEYYTLDANATAVLFGVCEIENRAQVLSFMREKFWTPNGSVLCWPKEKASAINHNHTENIWPFVNCLEIEARMMCGRFDEADALVRRVYGNMLSRGADTFWEFYDAKTGNFVVERMEQVEDDRDNYDSECHGWSAGIAALYLQYAAGLKPLAPGYRICAVAPHFMGNRLEAVCPTEWGLISMKLVRSAFGVELNISAPAKVTLVWEGEGTLSSDCCKIENGMKFGSGVYLLDPCYYNKKEAVSA